MASACSIVMANEHSSMIGAPGLVGNAIRTRASTCLLMSVAIVCVCALVVCGVLIVREYTLAKAYAPTVCMFNNITYVKDTVCTYCTGTKDKNNNKASSTCFTIQFPCVHIIVAYQVNETRRKGMLHQDSVQAAGVYKECSFSINTCQKTREDNLRVVEEYADLWRTRAATEFRCFYDTDDPDRVIAHKTYSLNDVIHSMLWPSVVIFVCGLIFLHLESQRRGLTFCGRKEQSAVDENHFDPDHFRDPKFTMLKPDQLLPGENSSPHSRRLYYSNANMANGTPERHPFVGCGGRNGGIGKQGNMSTSMSSLEKTRSKERSSPKLLKQSAKCCKSASVDRLRDVRIVCGEEKPMKQTYAI